MTQSCANWLTPRRCPQGSFLPWVFTSHCLGASAYPVTRDVRTLKREQVLTSSSFPAQGPWHLQKQLPGSSLALEGAGPWIFVCLFCLAFQLDTRGTVWEQEHPLRKCHHQIGPWAFPWLVTDGRGYCPPPPRVGSPRVSKKADWASQEQQDSKRHSFVVSASVPVLISYSDGLQPVR